MNKEIKVGFCVAYDWPMLQYSIPQVYAQADKICLSIDKRRISWSGMAYRWDETAFRNMVRGLDPRQKICIVEEEYYLPSQPPIQNEFLQRRRLAEHLGKGGWHIQLDCDEYLLEFPSFVRYLGTLSSRLKKINVCCAFIHLYKKIEGGFLAVDPVVKSNIELIPIATRGVVYENGRKNKAYNVFTNFRVLHQSWARSEEEVTEKIFNWGHSNEFDKEAYLKRWRELSGDNYSRLTDIHPLTPPSWPRLALVRGESVGDMISDPNIPFMPVFSRNELLLFNSTLLQRINSLRLQLTTLVRRIRLNVRPTIKLK